MYGPATFSNNSKPSHTTSFEPSVPSYPGDNGSVATAPPVTSSTNDNQVFKLFEQVLPHLIFCNFIVLRDAFMLISLCISVNW